MTDAEKYDRDITRLKSELRKTTADARPTVLFAAVMLAAIVVICFLS